MAKELPLCLGGCGDTVRYDSKTQYCRNNGCYDAYEEEHGTPPPSVLKEELDRVKAEPTVSSNGKKIGRPKKKVVDPNATMADRLIVELQELKEFVMAGIRAQGDAAFQSPETRLLIEQIRKLSQTALDLEMQQVKLRNLEREKELKQEISKDNFSELHVELYIALGSPEKIEELRYSIAAALGPQITKELDERIAGRRAIHAERYIPSQVVSALDLSDDEWDEYDEYDEDDE